MIKTTRRGIRTIGFTDMRTAPLKSVTSSSLILTGCLKLSSSDEAGPRKTSGCYGVASDRLLSCAIERFPPTGGGTEGLWYEARGVENEEE